MPIRVKKDFPYRIHILAVLRKLKSLERRWFEKKWGEYKSCYPNWHELRKQEKCSSLVPHRSTLYKTQWAWQGVKLTWLISIFTSKRGWKWWIKIIWQNLIQKGQGGGKCPASWQLRLKGTRITLHKYYNQYLRWPRIICQKEKRRL